MREDKLSKFLETHRRMLRQLNPLFETSRAFSENLRNIQAVESNLLRENLLRSSITSNAELGLLQVNTDFGPQFRQQLEQLNHQMQVLKRDFILPEMINVAQLMPQSNQNLIAGIMKRYQIQMFELESPLKKMTTAWLNSINQISSIRGFAALEGIGLSLERSPTFDPHFTQALRIDLGDWRKKLTYPSAILKDPLARASFYTDRGLNPDLTAFPPDAFSEILSAASIKGAQLPVVEEYDLSSKQEEGDYKFERTRNAYDRIRRFETHLRRFIDEEMQKAFGANWIKHQIPGEMRQQWLDKKQSAVANGESALPLIAYADFTDYEKIISRKDNWNTVFKPIFRAKTSVQESFQRLFPIRLCVMHSRLISQDDELYLLVETKRILGAVGVTA